MGMDGWMDGWIGRAVYKLLRQRISCEMMEGKWWGRWRRGFFFWGVGQTVGKGGGIWEIGYGGLDGGNGGEWTIIEVCEREREGGRGRECEGV